jgi:hypothetical protein
MTETPGSVFTFADVQRAIDEAVSANRSAMQAEHDDEMAGLRAQIAGAVAVNSPTPPHAGGPGFQIKETWSLAEQQAEIARERAEANA